jgi:hypothetical protein
MAKIDLANGEQVQGVLPPANGGSGEAGTITGLVKAAGTGAYSAAVAGTDYCAATTGSTILKGSSGSTTPATAGTDYLTPGGTQTLTATRITKRVLSITYNVNPTWDTDNADLFNLTLTGGITNMSTNLTGTPNDGDSLLVRLTGSSAQTISAWGSKFGNSGAATVLAATLSTKTHENGFRWSASKSLWICVFVDPIGY